MKAFVVSVLLAVIGAICFAAWGCQPVHQATTPPTPPAVFTHPGQTPAELTGVAKSLDYLIVLSVIAVGAGIGLYFVLPTHGLPAAIAFVGAGVEVSSLLLRVSLWFIPYVAIGLAVLAAVLLAYEIYANRSKLEAISSTGVTKLVHG